MAEGHKRHWPKTRETFKLSNQKTVRDIPRERAKNSPSRPHSDLSNHNILLKKGKDRRQRAKSRTSPNEFSSSICRHTYHQRLHKTSKQKWNCFLMQIKSLYLPMQIRHLTLVVLSIFFPVLKASRRRENSISHTGMCQRIACLLNGIKMQLSNL